MPRVSELQAASEFLAAKLSNPSKTSSSELLLTEFCTFLTAIFGRRPECFDLDYKSEHSYDHVAKFRGDRPRELGDLALKKVRKETAVKHKRAANYSVPGGQ